MFNTLHIRLLLAGAWIVALVGLWWGYGTLTGRYDLEPDLARVDQAVAAGNWAEAEQAVDRLLNRWEAARPIVELNHGGMLLEDFDLAMGRLEGGMAAQDSGPVRMELAGLRVHWRGLEAAYPDGK